MALTTILTGVLGDAKPASAATLCENSACSNGVDWLAAMNSDPDGNGWGFWNMALGHNCTGYAAWRLIGNGVAKPTGAGNASNWAIKAAAAGYLVDSIPAVGAIAQWNANAGGYGSEGHVAYVEEISGNVVTVSEDTYGAQTFRWRTISAGTPSNYIHLNDQLGVYGGFKSVLSPADFDGDGKADILTVSTNGNLSLYRGNGTGGFASGGPTVIGTSFDTFKSVLSPADLNADGKRDLVALATDGTVYAYYGNGTGGFLAGGPTVMGANFQTFKTILSPVDFDGDGQTDLISITSDGTLSLHLRYSSGTFSPTAVEIVGTGF